MPRIKFYLLALLVLQVFSCLHIWETIRGGMYMDFRTFYTAGHMVRTGHSVELYDYTSEVHFQNQLVSVSDRALPMMCPPFTALMFVPLSLLSFWHAYFLFLAINVELLATSAVVIVRHLPAFTKRWRAGPYLLWLGFFPAAVAVMMGQLSPILLLVYCLCFVAWKKERHLIAGLLLSLSLMKFQVAIPIAFVFLLWRQWRFLAGFLSGTTALAGISAAMVGPGNLLVYLHSLVSMTSSVTSAQAEQLKFGIIPNLMPNLYGFFFSLTHGAFVGTVLVFLTSIALILWAATRRPSFPLALLVSVLVSYHLFLYDLTILLLPLSLVIEAFVVERDSAAALNTEGKMREQSPLWLKLATASLVFSPVGILLVKNAIGYLLAVPILAIVFGVKYWDSLSPSITAEKLVLDSGL